MRAKRPRFGVSKSITWKERACGGNGRAPRADRPSEALLHPRASALRGSCGASSCRCGLGGGQCRTREQARLAAFAVIHVQATTASRDDHYDDVVCRGIIGLTMVLSAARRQTPSPPPLSPDVIPPPRAFGPAPAPPKLLVVRRSVPHSLYLAVSLLSLSVTSTST